MQRLSGLLVLILGIGASALAFWWLRRERPPEPAGPGRPPFVLPVTVGSVERGTLTPSLELVGDVQAARRARLAFETAGWVRTTAAQDGDRIVEQQELARLDGATQRVRVAEERAAVLLAQRELEKLEAGERGEVVARLAAEVETAKADLRLAELDVERGAQLLEESVLSQATQDRNIATRDARAGSLDAARQRLEEARAGSRVEDIAIARASLDAAKARLAIAEQDLSETVLRAPWDGVVVERLLDEGDFAPAGEGVFDLIDLSTLEVVLEVPAGAGFGLEVGAPVELRLDERPGEVFANDLDVVVPVADAQSRNFRALVRLSEVDSGFGALRPGQFVRASIELAPYQDALLVSEDALRVTDRGTVLVVAEPIPGASPPSGPPTGPPAPWLRAAWVPVRVLGSSEGTSAVEPVAGELEPGQEVVLTGVDRAFPGVSLMPIEGDSPSGSPAEGGPEGGARGGGASDGGAQ